MNIYSDAEEEVHAEVPFITGSGVDSRPGIENGLHCYKMSDAIPLYDKVLALL